MADQRSDCFGPSRNRTLIDRTVGIPTGKGSFVLWIHSSGGARDPFLRADAHHTVLAAGTGLNSNNVKLDIALEYRWGRFDQTMSLAPVYQAGLAEELGLALPPEAQGTAGFREVRLKVSMIYRITRSEGSGSTSSK